MDQVTWTLEISDWASQTGLKVYRLDCGRIMKSKRIQIGYQIVTILVLSLKRSRIKLFYLPGDT